MRCTSCGALVYPRINPAVVAAVRDGDRLLLIRYADRPMTTARYALIAGFTEIGETMEQTVRREVMGLQGRYIVFCHSRVRPLPKQMRSAGNGLSKGPGIIHSDSSF